MKVICTYPKVFQTHIVTVNTHEHFKMATTITEQVAVEQVSQRYIYKCISNT